MKAEMKAESRNEDKDEPMNESDFIFLLSAF
jgi:hypothetical protein